MPATDTPLPISARRVRAHFANFLDALSAVANEAFPTAVDTDAAITSLINQALRAWQYRLEELSGIAFFVTRYCTRELASQLVLTIGTDFDRYVQPKAYRRDAWLKQTGRTKLPHAFLQSIEKFRLTLEANSQIADIDLNWLQKDDEKGIVHVIPSGLATAGLNFQSLYGVSIFVRGAAVGRVPLLVHLRYTAGLVKRTGTYAAPSAGTAYDPDAYPVNTVWSQELVEAYRKQLEQGTVGMLYQPVGAHLSAGGVRISLDGMGETIDGNELQTRGEKLTKAAEAWAQDQQEHVRGIGAVMI